MLPYTVAMVRENLGRVRGRIEEACKRVGRKPESVKLIAVTKEAEFSDILEVIEEGVVDIGENRVQEAISKKGKLSSYPLTWHMLGHLQSNKVRSAVELFSVIHSLDSVRLAYIINTEAEKLGNVEDVLIEINISGEKSKFGIKPEELTQFLAETKSLKSINILGLMTITPLAKDPEETRPYFRRLKELAEAHGLKELSMGMTQDFEVAVEEGATMVRIGNAIFKNTNG